MTVNTQLTVASSLRCPKDGGQVKPDGKCATCAEPVPLGRPRPRRHRASARGQYKTMRDYEG